MAETIPSDVRPVGSSTPLVVSFTPTRSINLQLVFYADAGGTQPIAAGSGARDIEVATIDRVRYEEADIDDTLETVLPLGTWSVDARTWELVGLGAGASSVRLTASGGSNPGGAVSYRVLVRP
jgi:hypothetical protein